MERIHMNIYTEISYRLRAKESECSLSRDRGLSRPTVHKYKLTASLEGYLDLQREFPGREELAWVRVQDNGIGIAPEHQAHIFDRFYQADEARRRIDGAESSADEQASSGTGLGLAIVDWIARAHQGEIRLESELGQGSMFEVVLPTGSPLK